MRNSPSDLETRISAHERYGTRDIDAWMLDILRPRGMILDVGCGDGKQLKLLSNAIGCDESPALLSKAKKFAPVQVANFNDPLPYKSSTFDLVSCCFAIYYAADPQFTVSEMHRVLRPGGRLFTMGPMPNNKALFHEITNTKPYGAARYMPIVYPVIGGIFGNTQLHIFENPLIFDSAESFLEYARASLGDVDINREDGITITKVVGGVIAQK